MRPFRTKTSLRHNDNDDYLFFRTPFAKNQEHFTVTTVARELPFYLISVGKLSLTSSHIIMGKFYIYFSFTNFKIKRRSQSNMVFTSYDNLGLITVIKVNDAFLGKVMFTRREVILVRGEHSNISFFFLLLAYKAAMVTWVSRQSTLSAC